ncbi:MAG: GNAT family N-acetyltransferase [Gammaproteobacteria bacterium]|nr:GNAT family N-acetyltransferase [Gammaproteobacteria bacterium]
MSLLQFREATENDAQAVLNIVNLAYRTEGGWTTESHLVVGDRLVEEDYLAALNTPNTIIFLALEGDIIVGCIELKIADGHAHLGMLSVLPDRQNQGIASQLLAYAEQQAKQTYSAKIAEMLVLDVRQELLEFYYRKGYERADEYVPFPTDLNVGKPIDQNLMFEKVVKTL